MHPGHRGGLVARLPPVPGDVAQDGLGLQAAQFDERPGVPARNSATWLGADLRALHAAAARGYRFAVRVQEACAQRGQHSGAAVRGGAAADPEDDRAVTRVQRGPQQLAGAVRGRRERCEDAGGQPLEAARLGHLHDRGAVAQREGRRHLVAERTGDPCLPALEPGGDRRGDRSVTAVGHGQRLDLHARYGPAQPGRHPFGDLHGRQRPFELVRGDEHPLGLRGIAARRVRHLHSPCSPGPHARQGQSRRCDLNRRTPRPSASAQPLERRPKGRGAVSYTRQPPRGRDRPRRTGSRETHDSAHPGASRRNG
ncbi:hypothetical protein SVIOM74S_05014 [Streptomyces violarus]